MENQGEDKKSKRYERKPNFDMRAKLSRDGRFWILERVETWILPAQYLAVIAQNHALEKSQVPGKKPNEKPRKKGKRDANGNG